MTTTLTVASHPLLEIEAFVTDYTQPLGEYTSPASLLAYFGDDVRAPLMRDEEVRLAVRDLLRHGGFKPTGRSKPASEYLIKAIEKGWFSPEKGINLAVDACNVASLHSGLPISVVDIGRASPPFSVQICPPETRYVFNPSGQEIEISGLITLWDEEGPCGGPVKDSQRTKTHEQTQQTLSIVWGTRQIEGLAEEVAGWYRSLLHDAGVTTSDVIVQTTVS